MGSNPMRSIFLQSNFFVHPFLLTTVSMTISSITPNSTRNSRTILIVDDEPINLELLEHILTAEGYAVLKAFDGHDAIDTACKDHPDLIIMDINMPRVDGITACKTIKENVKDRFIPIILLTSHHATEVEVLGFDSGADEYLIKPPKKPELLARVRAMIRTRDLHEELHRTKKIIEHDLDEVGAIQRSFLPTEFPYHPQIDFGHFYGPCQSAGGDYFDVIEIGHSHWGLLVADVTGHGASAAVVMAITHTLMHSFTNSFRYPSTALKVANEKLNAHLAPTFYVTMFYSVLNLQTMTLRYASAGHEPMMLYKAKTNDIEWLKTEHGFPLKLMAADDYDEKTIPVEAGDKIIFFTDGIVERRNPQGKLLSEEQLRKWVVEFGHLQAQAFVDAVIEKVKNYNPELPFQDDVTMFVIHRTV